jgi:prevent-host-death family protein
MIIGAGKFKAECLKLMDRVCETQEEIIISKRGHPVARLVPIERKPLRSIFGHAKNSVVNETELTYPTGETWDAES